MKVTELKDQLRARGLRTGGYKYELIERLVADQAECATLFFQYFLVITITRAGPRPPPPATCKS